MVEDLQRRTLAAISESILPSDEGPGAAEAGVTAYVEGALQSLSPQKLRGIASGLDLVECLSNQRHGKSFADCVPEEREDVLKHLQRVPHRLTHSFLATLVDLTLEAFFCDPSYGGNRNRAGWLYIGYEPRRTASE
jgi:gluconate 2-dehydrogenase gamma chain